MFQHILWNNSNTHLFMAMFISILEYTGHNIYALQNEDQYMPLSGSVKVFSNHSNGCKEVITFVTELTHVHICVHRSHHSRVPAKFHLPPPPPTPPQNTPSALTPIGSTDCRGTTSTSSGDGGRGGASDSAGRGGRSGAGEERE